jgi:hypothetical protein
VIHRCFYQLSAVYYPERGDQHRISLPDSPDRPVHGSPQAKLAADAANKQNKAVTKETKQNARETKEGNAREGNNIQKGGREGETST